MSIDASLPWTPKAHLRFHQKLCEQLPKKFIRNPEKYLNKHIKTPESPWPWGDLTQHSSIKWSRLFCRLFPREHRFGGVEHLFAYFCNTYLPTILPSPGMKTSHTAWFNNQLSDVTSRRVRAVALSKLRWIEKQEYFSPYAIREILEKSHPPASSDLPAPPLPLPVTPHQVSHKWTEVHSEKLYRIIAERLPHLSKDPKKAINTYLERAKVYQWPWNARFGRYCVIWSKIASEEFFEERFTAEKLEKKFHNKVFREKFLKEPPLTFTNEHQEWLRQYVEKHGKTAWKEASIAFFQQYQYYVSDKELLQLHEKSEPSPVSNDLASAAAPVVSLELPVEQDRLPVPPYLPVASHLLVASHLPVASQQNITSPPDELTDEIQPSSDEQRISSQWKPHHEQLLIKSINAVLPRFAANPKSAIGESITLRKEWPWKAVRWMKIAEKFSRDISDVSKLSKYIRQHFEDVTVPVILSQANQTRPPHITKAINDLLLIRPAYQISEIAHCIFQQHEWYMSPNSVRNIRNSIRQRHRLPASKRKSSSLEEPPSKIPRTAAASPTQGRPATPPEYVEERDSPFSLDSFDSLPSLSSADVVSQFFK